MSPPGAINASVLSRIGRASTPVFPRRADSGSRYIPRPIATQTIAFAATAATAYEPAASSEASCLTMITWISWQHQEQGEGEDGNPRSPPQAP